MSTSPLDALGDGIRRRILEFLAGGEQPVGALVSALASWLTGLLDRWPFSQPLDALATEVADLTRCRVRGGTPGRASRSARSLVSCSSSSSARPTSPSAPPTSRRAGRCTSPV